MNRFQKKCLIVSASLHGFLVLVLVFGSAFFVAKEKPVVQSRLQFVPSIDVENALAGGGGNPNIARTDDVQKGSPDAPKQLMNPPPQLVVPPPVQPRPIDPPPPNPEPKRAEKKVQTPKPAPTPSPKKPIPKPVEKPAPIRPRIDLSELKPVKRRAEDKRKEEAEAEAREAARREAAANTARQKLLSQIGKATESMQRGFASGTKVDVGGPGGEAYASYGSLVQAVYEDAWKIFQDLNDDDAVAVVRVTIARSGRVLEARFLKRSSSSSMNKSVQRAMDGVKDIGRPFPDFIKDAERSFTIEFNLKANRLSG